MNLKNKSFSIYAHDKMSENDGLWFRIRSFKTMASAVQSLRGLTRTPKEERNLSYIILPNNNEQRKFIVFNQEHIQTALNSSK